MSKLFFVNLGCDLGEGFCDAKGKVLAAWNGNDANWRGEYMDGLLEALGHTVEYDGATPAMKKAIAEYTGSEEYMEDCDE